MNLLEIKNRLVEEYKDLTRNDLIWLLALKSNKATFDGTFREYFHEHMSKLKSIENKVSTGNYIEIIKTKDGVIKKATIDGVDVILKRIVEWEKYKLYSGYVYEAFINKYFFGYMLREHITPNVPFLYKIQIYPYDIKGDKAIMISTYMESLGGMRLKRMIKNYKIDAYSWKIVLFQIIYTLLCFQQMGLRHNDLHLSNIYIDSGIRGEINYKISDDTNYTVPIDGIGLVKIFDMDYASVDCSTQFPKSFDKDLALFKKHVNSYYGTNCENPLTKDPQFLSLGIAPSGRGVFDLYVVLCYIYGLREKMRNNKEILDFIQSIFTEEELLADNPYYCRNIKYNDPYNYRSLSDLIQDPFFNVFKNKQTTTTNNFHLPKLLPSTKKTKTLDLLKKNITGYSLKEMSEIL